MPPGPPIKKEEEEMIDPTVAYEKIASLGSATEIAEFLHELGISGHRTSAHTCALSQYMNTMTGQTFATAFALERLSPPCTYELTPAMDDFVTLFDSGRYPEITKERNVTYS